jgi:hypothetical protein
MLAAEPLKELLQREYDGKAAARWKRDLDRAGKTVPGLDAKIAAGAAAGAELDHRGIPPDMRYC